jgi:hypothetical protein
MKEVDIRPIGRAKVRRKSESAIASPTKKAKLGDTPPTLPPPPKKIEQKNSASLCAFEIFCNFVIDKVELLNKVDFFARKTNYI